MEPMHLGSPTQTLGSPGWPASSPGAGGAASTPAQMGGAGGYLPGYLMGDPHHQMSPASPLLSRQLSSPNKLNRSMSNMSATGQGISNVSTPMQQFSSTRGPGGLLKETLNNSGRLHRSEKPGGPPTTSLFTPNSSMNAHNQSHHISRFDTTGGYEATPTKNQEIMNQGEDMDPLSVWITVFGFPPSAASYVLQQLSTCGTVLQHMLVPNANWMHIRFQTKLQARKAISKNGAVLGGSIMIGVAQCTEDSVLDQANTSMSTIDTSLVGSGVTNLSSNFGTPRTIRPLAQAYKDATTENKIVPATNTPNKNTGIVSKAMECMFGW
eukprot:TRINITY_DN11129_c0_g1_i1.p1 TRINITY_DN11129_c0_g1~~TRINITY_DN11129_c0_g1_i1.p1  ORF type:complete len:324 (+),score=38.55 TRINITY_DN11129_c0_g1_i1:35-1006(+)